MTESHNIRAFSPEHKRKHTPPQTLFPDYATAHSSIRSSSVGEDQRAVLANLGDDFECPSSLLLPPLPAVPELTLQPKGRKEIHLQGKGDRSNVEQESNIAGAPLSEHDIAMTLLSFSSPSKFREPGRRHRSQSLVGSRDVDHGHFPSHEFQTRGHRLDVEKADTISEIISEYDASTERRPRSKSFGSLLTTSSQAFKTVNSNGYHQVSFGDSQEDLLSTPESAFGKKESDEQTALLTPSGKSFRYQKQPHLIFDQPSAHPDQSDSTSAIRNTNDNSASDWETVYQSGPFTDFSSQNELLKGTSAYHSDSVTWGASEASLQEQPTTPWSPLRYNEAVINLPSLLKNTGPHPEYSIRTASVGNKPVFHYSTPPSPSIAALSSSATTESTALFPPTTTFQNTRKNITPLLAPLLDKSDFSSGLQSSSVLPHPPTITASDSAYPRLHNTSASNFEQMDKGKGKARGWGYDNTKLYDNPAPTTRVADYGPEFSYDDIFEDIHDHDDIDSGRAKIPEALKSKSPPSMDHFSPPARTNPLLAFPTTTNLRSIHQARVPRPIADLASKHSTESLADNQVPTLPPLAKALEDVRITQSSKPAASEPAFPAKPANQISTEHSSAGLKASKVSSTFSKPIKDYDHQNDQDVSEFLRATAKPRTPATAANSSSSSNVLRKRSNKDTTKNKSRSDPPNNKITQIGSSNTDTHMSEDNARASLESRIERLDNPAVRVLGHHGDPAKNIQGSRRSAGYGVANFSGVTLSNGDRIGRPQMLILHEDNLPVQNSFSFINRLPHLPDIEGDESVDDMKTRQRLDIINDEWKRLKSECPVFPLRDEHMNIPHPVKAGRMRNERLEMLENGDWLEQAYCSHHQRAEFSTTKELSIRPLHGDLVELQHRAGKLVILVACLFFPFGGFKLLWEMRNGEAADAMRWASGNMLVDRPHADERRLAGFMSEVFGFLLVVGGICGIATIIWMFIV